MLSAFNFITNSRTKPQGIAARMAAARRRGAGAYLHEWKYSIEAAQATTIETVLEPIVAWCKETLGATRRPWGIDQFDLVIAVRHGDSEPRSLSLSQQAPGDLYGHEMLVGVLRRFLEQDGRDRIAHVSIALFSWGDAAHAAIRPRTVDPTAT